MRRFFMPDGQEENNEIPYDVWGIWRVDEFGHAGEFIAVEFYSFTFGPDGAMYVSEYDWEADVVTISRVSLIPEPATLTLMAIGGLALLKRRKLSLK